MGSHVAISIFSNSAKRYYKAGSDVAPGGKYPLQDLNSAARSSRLVRKFSLEFLRGNARFDRTRSKMNQARILKKHSPTKSHQNRQETDFTRLSCKRLPAKIV